MRPVSKFRMTRTFKWTIASVGGMFRDFLSSFCCTCQSTVSLSGRVVAVGVVTVNQEMDTNCLAVEMHLSFPVRVQPRRTR